MIKLTQLSKFGNSIKSGLLATNRFHASRLNRSSEQFEPSPNYENKNPRNLEWSGHQYKRFGWNLQYPPKDFYHQVVFRNHSTSLEAYVEHHSGKKIVYASSEEPSLRQYLYSSKDLCAAKNLAKVFADRCLQFGLTQMNYLKSSSFESSPKEKIFYNTLVESGLKLEEPEFKERQDFSPGLDYDNKDFHQNRQNKPFPPELNKLKKLNNQQ